MKMTRAIWITVLILGFVLLSSGCSSLDKARSLHRSGETQKALEMAQDLLDDGENLQTRLGAIALLEEIGGEKAGRILLPVLDDEDLTVKNAAIKSIGRIGYAPASKKLLEIGMSSTGETFETAAGAIRAIGSPAIDLLVKNFSASGSTSEQERYKALMLEVGPSVASGIAKNLAGKSYFENRVNFELLIAFKSPEVADWLLKEIGNREVAENVVEGLVKLGSLAVSPVLQRLENTPADRENDDVRVRMITVLGKLKAKAAVGTLEKLTRDSRDSVRDAANLALKRIRGF